MSDLIERQAAVEAIENHKGLTNVAKLEAMNQILTIPSARPVHGEWIKNDNGIYVCGNCGYMPSSEGYTYYHYCPNCGVKVRSTINE